MEVSSANKVYRVALLGNPNSGKSSLFNHLTGLNQKVGNYPGVTVDKKSGSTVLPDGSKVQVMDLPGLYSLYPKSADEKVVLDILANAHGEEYPELVIVIADASNLKRNLLLFSQVCDLGIPTILALNMIDVAARRGITVDTDVLSNSFGVPVFAVNGRTGEGVKEIKSFIQNPDFGQCTPSKPALDLDSSLVDSVRQISGTKSDYLAFHHIVQTQIISGLSEEERRKISDLKNGVDVRALQTKDTVGRYQSIGKILERATSKTETGLTVTQRLDSVLTHKIWGYLIFFTLLFLVFQAIFEWATVPMDLIDESFGNLSFWIKNNMPAGVFTDLVSEGVVPGIGGIVIFIPQIAILFGFVALLEDTGYMARVVFLMDKLMRPFGLSGKSVVPLVSGVACAVPAIMAARNIDGWKERITTIFVTPFTTCSARLPVYVILISLVVPDESYLGLFNLQGLILMFMYLLGFAMAFVVGLAMKYILKAKSRSFLIMEMPYYKTPRWKNIGLTMWQKTVTFVTEPGKIIFAISIILWVLSSYGPSEVMNGAEDRVRSELAGTDYTQKEFENRLQSEQLESSYAAYLGKVIEPVIKPLGYDWKIGIALIASFAAREVFIGTIATIYSVGDDFEDEKTIRARLAAEKNPETGKPMYDLPLAFSLLIFYAFAMQCMSTLAVVYRETGGWKWPILQTVFMTGLAYISALVVYQILK